MNTPDEFLDPDGLPYVFVFQGAVTTANADETWIFGTAATQDSITGHQIRVYSPAECVGENVRTPAGGGTRRVAFRMKLEGAGTYCVDNA